MKIFFYTILIISSINLSKVFAGERMDSSDSFNDVITEYINLKNDLVSDNGSDAAVSAGNLLKAVKNIQTAGLTTEEIEVWSQYSQDLENVSGNISGSTDVEYQRQQFMGLSADLFKVLKSINKNTTNLYYQFCPMANDGKGAYWISDQSKISNPYFGKKMLRCGETRNTLKAKE